MFPDAFFTLNVRLNALRELTSAQTEKVLDASELISDPSTVT